MTVAAGPTRLARRRARKLADGSRRLAGGGTELDGVRR
jgi:hypothetical protein